MSSEITITMTKDVYDKQLSNSFSEGYKKGHTDLTTLINEYEKSGMKPMEWLISKQPSIPNYSIYGYFWIKNSNWLTEAYAILEVPELV